MLIAGFLDFGIAFASIAIASMVSRGGRAAGQRTQRNIADFAIERCRDLHLSQYLLPMFFPWRRSCF